MCFTFVKVTGVFPPVYFALSEENRRKHNPGARSKDSAMASLSAAMNFEHGDGDEEYLLNGNESYATNHRHLPRASETISLSAGDHQSTAVL